MVHSCLSCSICCSSVSRASQLPRNFSSSSSRPELLSSKSWWRSQMACKKNCLFFHWNYLILCGIICDAIKLGHLVTKKNRLWDKKTKTESLDCLNYANYKKFEKFELKRFFVQLFLCLAIRLFNLIESQKFMNQ